MKKNIVLPLILMFVFALSRWPGIFPGNFSAAYAIMFCAGIYFPARLAWSVPLATLLMTDILIDIFAYPDTHLPVSDYIKMMIPSYIAYVAILILGRGLRNGNRSWFTLVGGGIIGAFVFYFVTNTAAWMSLSYTKTLSGWIQALTTGLPGFPSTWEFFRNSLMSGGLFTGLFVGAVKLFEPAESAEEKKEPAKEPEPEAEPEPEHAKS